MDHRTRTDVLLMTVELRLAARAPSELVGQRLPSHRLQEIAAALEERLAEPDRGARDASARPANAPQPAPAFARAIRLRGRARST